MRLMEKVKSRFEEQLDIRSFVRVRTNLALLLRLLLTDEQLLLFRHQRRKSISVAIKGEKSSSSIEETSDDLGKHKPQEELSKQWSLLRGFKAQTDLDKILVKGVFHSGSMRRVGIQEAQRSPE